MKKKGLKIISISALLVLLLAIVLLFFTDQDFFSQKGLANFRDFIENLGFWAPVVFLLIYYFVVLLFISAGALSVLAGSLFGPFWGSLYVVLAATLAAQTAFTISRIAGRDLIRKIPNKGIGKLVKRLEEQLDKSGFQTLFLMRFLFLPYIPLSYAAGLLPKAKSRDFFLATLLSNAIISPAFVLVGNSILEGPVAIIISLFLLIIVLSIPKVIRRWRQLGENEYDLIIIGSGSGGLNIAGFMNRAGFKILLVEKNEANIGGDCLNTGCVPSKALIHCARLRKGANEYAKLNSSSKPKSADFKAIKDYLNQKIAQIRQHENKAYFEKLGMQIKIGQAQFISKEEIQVGSDKYWGQKIIIATGSRPFIPKIKGILRVEYQTNETIFGLSKLPQKLLIIGAGPIGIELGSAFANLGSNVKVVQSQERILPKEDAELSQKLQSLLLDEGVKFYLNSRVVEFPTSNTAKIVNKISEKEEIVEFDQVLIATGRYLDFSELNLPAANIKLKNNGQLIVNKKLQTTNKNVLVAGDAAGGYQFTHAAELHASVIINNFFSPFKRKLNYDSFGWVTFTTPEVATFGLNEAELNKRQIEYQVLRKKLDHDDRAITDNYSEQGLIKLFVHKNKRILGGSILAPEAGEIAQELMLAISQKLKAKDLFYRTYPYPVRSRITKSTLSPVFADKLNNTRTRKILKFLYS